MLWDGSFDAWDALDVTGQPTVVLLDTDGTELGRWFGLAESEILELVG